MTMKHTEQIHALVMLSGGLDSQLAICVLKEQGIDVQGVVFDSPFFNIALAQTAAKQLGIHLHIINFTPDIMKLLAHAKHGYGSCMNPCIDCHSLMIHRAGELLQDLGFHFIATGEVLDQRPMSQNRHSLKVVAEDSGIGDILLRPLSAGLLPKTKPETMEWVDRSRLLSLNGRSRKPQFQLAEKYGLKSYPTPAGGCLLTEPNFCKRLKDLKDNEGFNGVHSIKMLRAGRHFRLRKNLKIIVGRNEQDNATIEERASLHDLILKPESIPGPTGLIPCTATEDDIQIGAAICARYCNVSEGETVAINIISAQGVRYINATPADPKSTEQLRI